MSFNPTLLPPFYYHSLYLTHMYIVNFTCMYIVLPTYLYSADPPGPQIQQDPGPGDLTLLSHGASRPHVGVVRVVDRERERERKRARERYSYIYIEGQEYIDERVLIWYNNARPVQP